MHMLVIFVLAVAAIIILAMFGKVIRKAHAKLAPEPMERDSVKEFEEANAVTPQQQRWLAFGAPMAYYRKESARIFKLLPDDYGNAKDLQPLLDMVNNKWQVTNTEEAKTLLESNVTCECDTPVVNEIYKKFIANHEKRDEPWFGRYLHDNFFVTVDDIKDLEGLDTSYKAAIKNSATALDWYIIAATNEEGYEEKTEEEIEKDIEEKTRELALNSLRATITGGVKSYGDVISRLTDPLIESHKHPHNETYNISNFAAFDLGSVAYTARACAAVGYLTEEEAWAYIKRAADTASRVYSNWHEYVAAYNLGDALAHGSMDSGIDAAKMNAYLIGHKNSPLKEVMFRP